MKKLLSIIVLATLFVTCTPEEYDHFATITGTVIDDESEDGLSGVQITMLPGGRKAYTGSDGFFQFNEVDSQQWTLQAQKTGYKTERIHVYPNAGETCTVNIRMLKEQ